MKKLYIETYGCQMNIADSEVVASILSPQYLITENINEADIFLINTCSVRDNAEQRIRKRLREVKALKQTNRDLIVGILGCMAERLKEQLLSEEKVLDLVAGPDSYRALPAIIEEVKEGKTSSHAILSEEETYNDIIPVRYDTNGVSAFISIMRGCNNFCSYCIVPYTRGRERSRDPDTILKEANALIKDGYKEIILLGQNVNSYTWNAGGNIIDFSKLIEMIAKLSPDLRVRFATSHPKDISDELLFIISNYSNVCSHIHLPVQSGSNNMLKKMNRGYSREYYLERIKTIKQIIPDCSITTDLIVGFCGETEEDHRATLSLMKEVGYSSAFMFKYSVREGTIASKSFIDDVSDNDKAKRFNEILTVQQELSLKNNQQDIGKSFEVLIEGVSKRSDNQLCGRNSQNKVIVFPKKDLKIGNYATVKVIDCTTATLIAE